MNGISKTNRKGQAATEFLMTYGWAILAIVIVAAVLWNMGVFKGQCAKTAPVQVFGSGEQLQVSDWSLDANNDLTLQIKNLAGNDLSINSGTMYLPSTYTTVANGTLGSNVSVSSGGSASVTIAGNGTGNSGDCFTGTVNLAYSVTDGVSHTVSGTIRGKY